MWTATTPFGGGGGGGGGVSTATTPFGGGGGGGGVSTATTPFGGGGGSGGGSSTAPQQSPFGSGGGSSTATAQQTPFGAFATATPAFGGGLSAQPFERGPFGSFAAAASGANPFATGTNSFGGGQGGSAGGEFPGAAKSKREEKDPSKAVVVSRLPTSADEEEVRAAFAGFGAVRSVKVVRQQGRAPFAYVNLEDAKAAQRAAAELNGRDALGVGRPIQAVVQSARKDQRRDQSPPPPEPWCVKLQPLPASCTDEQLRRALDEHDASAGLVSVKTIRRDGGAYGWANYGAKRDADAAAAKLRGASLFPGGAPVYCSVRQNRAAAPSKPSDEAGPSKPSDEAAFSEEHEDDDEDDFPPEMDDDELYGEDLNASQHKTAVFNTQKAPAPPPAPPKGDSMSRTVRVDNVPEDMTEARLKSTFATFGNVSAVSIQSGGYALVMFDDADAAALAATELDGLDAFSTGPLECRVCSSSTTRGASPPRRHVVSTNSKVVRAAEKTARRDEADDAEEERPAVVGTCELMCPQSEIDERVAHNELDDWERPEAPDVDLRGAARSLAVKRYKRSDAGSVQNVPELVRPPAVLRATLDHLESHVVRRQSIYSAAPGGVPDEAELATYMFLWDRFRAVRKDFILQNYTKGGLVDATVVDVFERMARYFIAMERRMAPHPQWRSGPAHGKHNAESLSETLTALRAFYDMARARGIGSVSEHEAEFTAYWMLFFDHEHGAEVSRLLDRLALALPDLRAAPEVALAAAVRESRADGNYAKFFALARTAPYLVRCLLVAQEASDVRSSALAVMGKAYKGGPYPAARLARLLGYDTTAEAVDAARDAGYKTTRRQIYFELHRDDEIDEQSSTASDDEAEPAGAVRGRRRRDVAGRRRVAVVRDARGARGATAPARGARARAGRRGPRGAARARGARGGGGGRTAAARRRGRARARARGAARGRAATRRGRTTQARGRGARGGEAARGGAAAISPRG